MRPAETIESLCERFHAKARKAPNGCWEWLGRFDSYGHAFLRTALRTGAPESVMVSHVAWRLQHGEWSKHKLRRICETGGCCNPAHLVKTEARSPWAGVSARKRRSTKLSAGQVRAIVAEWRAALEAFTSLQDLGRRYKCAPSTIAGVLAARGLPTRLEVGASARLAEDAHYRKRQIEAQRKRQGVG